MQNLEWYLADLKSTGKNTIETVEKSLTDMFIRLVRIYPCLIPFCLVEQGSANTGQSSNAVSMLGQRQRRWANIETALGECTI